MNIIARFTLNVLLSIDQMANTFLLGHPDETLSSRLGRAEGRERYEWVRTLRIFVDKIFSVFEEDHCKNSVMPLEQQNFRTIVDYEIWSWQKED